MPLRFPRRWFLALAALLATGGRAAGASGIAAVAPTGAAPHAELLRLLPARRDAVIIGRAYLDACPADRDLDALLRHFERLGAADTLRTAIAARLRKDFEDRDTVRVQGWILARTEARLCAICALLDAGAPSV
jgi:hypothetical protein